MFLCHTELIIIILKLIKYFFKILVLIYNIVIINSYNWHK